MNVFNSHSDHQYSEAPRDRYALRVLEVGNALVPGDDKYYTVNVPRSFLLMAVVVHRGSGFYDVPGATPDRFRPMSVSDDTANFLALKAQMFSADGILSADTESATLAQLISRVSDLTAAELPPGSYAVTKAGGDAVYIIILERVK